MARFYVDWEETHVAEIPEGTDSIPPEIDEGNLDASANALIPAGVVRPGLEMVIEIDPDETLDPDLGVTKRIPAEGRLEVDVHDMPPLSVTLVPFLWEEDPDSAILDVLKGAAKDPMGHEVLWGTRTLLPVRDLEVEGHEPVWPGAVPRLCCRPTRDSTCLPAGASRTRRPGAGDGLRPKGAHSPGPEKRPSRTLA